MDRPTTRLDAERRAHNCGWLGLVIFEFEFINFFIAALQMLLRDSQPARIGFLAEGFLAIVRTGQWFSGSERIDFISRFKIRWCGPRKRVNWQP